MHIKTVIMSNITQCTLTHCHWPFCSCFLLMMMMFKQGPLFESARHMSSLAAKWFLAFVLRCRSVEKPASHKNVVANGTRISKALPANCGNVWRCALQNVSSCIFFFKPHLDSVIGLQLHKIIFHHIISIHRIEFEKK